MIAKAFPCKGYIKNEDNTIGEFNYAGMDLRDYFAAKAMPSLVKTFENYVTTSDDVAKLAYQYADAMMKAREND